MVSLGLRPEVPIPSHRPADVPNADLFLIGGSETNLPPNDPDGNSSGSDNSLFGDDDSSDEDEDEEDEDEDPEEAARKREEKKARKRMAKKAANGSGVQKGGSAAQSPDLLMTAYIDGQVLLWDRRAPPQSKPLRLEMGEKSPPWCVSVSGNSSLNCLDACPAIVPPCAIFVATRKGNRTLRPCDHRGNGIRTRNIPLSVAPSLPS